MVFGLSMKSDNSSNTAQPKKLAPEQMQEAQRRSDKIVERLNEVVEQSPLGKHRSSDLVPLNAEFDKMKHELRALVNVSKKYQKTMEDMQDAKFEVRIESVK